MKINSFEEIISWQKSQELTVLIYKLFRASKDYSFRDQIQRATVSIGNNIAEGFERRSNNEFRHFLFIAKGSCGEVRSMAYLAVKLTYINDKDFETIKMLCSEISKLISGLIKTL
ncbi:MAG: four helix bundle protein [Candidatus Yanofskybacteria bacterium RIFCSPHIGHO2_02_FULL_44_12b]|uniref:Four helix bundle protein n=2 Tax=Candidatus Yanofskyibacteriota TaxID=1752733 RepID=A0A1F8GK51_9BACT|nr:MAG: S23 ribosomal protein [Candidatus Yanofskybacteria bacterium GW2011_GWA2_44_9]OGN04392.1 MAG: four helix bundle protein [Candidatus Yanofskybacteria bacterium RIFCSPHIGHO2_01_FULL_44_24]OGN16189.1 MAG: four helix bundle protein [Candidatus Yanofskybacteria bacterium RIFCSPHIGHO2_02_FULL_44_12b]OGN25782.1 MAG: four helix bundle protein [Candidatus Yanofskybacteria bacterium RIFCSPLOWO2_01_FULL_44_22]